MLDISIHNLDKVSEKYQDLVMSTPVSVESKSDGVKVNVFKVNDTGTYEYDYVVSYKGEIMYPYEHTFLSTENIKEHSIANSQFRLLHRYLSQYTKNDLKVGTELFIEFLMNKPTLSSKYERPHAMVLIGYCTTEWEISYGMIKSTSTEMKTEHREYIASQMGLDVPTTRFTGVLKTFGDYEHCKQAFLSVKSKYGGDEEGVVIKALDGSFIYKWVQDYQYDEEKRTKIKNQYKCPTESCEEKYWSNVRFLALKIVKELKPITESNYEAELEKAAIHLSSKGVYNPNPNKNNIQMLDDVQGNIKFILRKRIKGNNNFLFIGKFRILTSAHYKIIKDGLDEFDRGVICIITSKETKHTKDLRTRMVKQAFPNVEIIHHSTANLFSIMRKTQTNINTIICGSDRVEDYTRILKSNPDISVREIERKGDYISASRVIRILNMKVAAELCIPEINHNFYDELIQTYRPEKINKRINE